MKPPYYEDVGSKYGAPMGRRSNPLADFAGRRVHLRAVPAVDGDYDPGGAYWGSVAGDRRSGLGRMYCAWSWNDEGFLIVAYFRAGNRSEAKIIIHAATASAHLPNAKFYR